MSPPPGSTRHRRHGLGRQLIDEACTLAAARDADHVRMWVDETNPTAAEFYLAIGFVATGESQPVSEGSTERQTGYERKLFRAGDASPRSEVKTPAAHP